MSSGKFDAHVYAFRIEALRAAEAACVREWLPPMSDFAWVSAERYARGELTADEAVAEIVAAHRSHQEIMKPLSYVFDDDRYAEESSERRFDEWLQGLGLSRFRARLLCARIEAWTKVLSAA